MQRQCIDQTSDITSVDFDIKTEQKQAPLIELSEQDEDSSVQSYDFSERSAKIQQAR